jgi:hypothetical protein
LKRGGVLVFDTASRWIPGTRLIRLREIEHLHVLFVELEVVEFGVIFDPLRGDALREWDIALILNKMFPRDDRG